MQTVYRQDSYAGAPDADFEPTTRTIPANLEAERAVLSSCLLAPDAYAKAAALLKSTDFYRERNAWIFAAMAALHDRRDPIDYVLLMEELDRAGRLKDIGGPGYLTDMVSANASPFYVEHYAGVVAQASQRRQLISAAGRVAGLAGDESNDLTAAIDEIQALILAASETKRRGGLRHIGPIVHEVIAHIDDLSRTPDRLMGVPTGYTMLDRVLGGLQKSDLIILAARPGMGKSSLAFSIALNAAKVGARVAAFSLEMSDTQLVTRMLATTSGIDSHRLRLGSVNEYEMHALVGAGGTLAALPLYLDDTPATSINEIRSRARKLYAEGGLDLLIVDYMQLMSGSATSAKGDNRHQELSKISKGLKGLARELDIPVVALSQLSRAVEQRADKRPMLSDLRESGAIEEDADVVMFIYREDYYNEETDRQNIADILVAKHRHGATGTVSLFFRKELTQFRDLEIKRTDLNN